MFFFNFGYLPNLQPLKRLIAVTQLTNYSKPYLESLDMTEAVNRIPKSYAELILFSILLSSKNLNTGTRKYVCMV